MRKVCIKTSLSQVSGYGADGWGIVRAFDRLGWDTHIVCMSLSVPAPPDLVHLLAKHPDPPYDLFINHCDPQQLALSRGERAAARVALGWTMWEWESFENCNEEFRQGVKDNTSLFDAVVAYDPVSKMAMESEIAVPVWQQQGGFWPEDWPLQRQRSWDDPFKFCMVAHMNPRKNPFLAVEAFAELKAEHGDAFNAELHLKTLTQYFHPSMEQAYKGLFIHYEYFTHKQLLEFYSQMHCLISTSHGEGKNMPALEAMSTGIPVIATAFGGHTQWQNPDYSFDLAFKREPIFGPAIAAQPSKEHLKELMWEAYSNRAKTRQMGELASATVAQSHSWQHVVQRVLDKLPENGLYV